MQGQSYRIGCQSDHPLGKYRTARHPGLKWQTQHVRRGPTALQKVGVQKNRVDVCAQQNKSTYYVIRKPGWDTRCLAYRYIDGSITLYHYQYHTLLAKTSVDEVLDLTAVYFYLFIDI